MPPIEPPLGIIHGSCADTGCTEIKMESSSQHRKGDPGEVLPLVVAQRHPLAGRAAECALPQESLCGAVGRCSPSLQLNWLLRMGPFDSKKNHTFLK